MWRDPCTLLHAATDPLITLRYAPTNNVAIRPDRVLSYSNSAGEMLKKGFSTVVGAARCGNRALACVSESCHCGPGQAPRRYESFCLNTRCPSVELRAAGCTLLPNELSDV